MNAALVPVKRLAAGKSRLAGALDRDALEGLVRAMLEDVVSALHAVDEVDAVFVVTPDADVAELAEEAGAEALLRHDPGLNASIDAAAAELETRGVHSLLVVLGDVAGVRPDEVARLYAALAAQGGGAVMAPAADKGTAALLRAPAACIPSRFGPESAKAHREAAAAAGVPLRELALPSLALDLDLPEDLQTLSASREAHAPRTRALLERLHAAGRT